MADPPTHVLIDRESLEILVTVADAALADLEAGLDDGTYEEPAIGGVNDDAIAAAIETAGSVLHAT